MPTTDGQRQLQCINHDTARSHRTFIALWAGVTASELSTAQSFTIAYAVCLRSRCRIPRPGRTTCSSARSASGTATAALAQGGTLEDRPRYNKSRCFETFPLPVTTPEQQARIRDLTEQIDAHRKRVLASHAELTLTGLYNVLVKVGAGDTAILSAKERVTYDKGLVAVLKSLHDDLDAAVLAAYSWSDNPGDATILERLVALNTERSAEETQGNIRWLRPEFQAPAVTQTVMAGVGDSEWRNVQPDEAPSPSPPPATR